MHKTMTLDLPAGNPDRGCPAPGRSAGRCAGLPVGCSLPKVPGCRPDRALPELPDSPHSGRPPHCPVSGSGPGERLSTSASGA